MTGPSSQIQRTAFRTSRTLGFLSEKELTLQCGYDTDDWPLVIVKELVDNALDACEEQGIPPEITITIDETSITVEHENETVKGTKQHTCSPPMKGPLLSDEPTHYSEADHQQVVHALARVGIDPYVPRQASVLVKMDLGIQLTIVTEKGTLALGVDDLGKLDVLRIQERDPTSER